MKSGSNRSHIQSRLTEYLETEFLVELGVDFSEESNLFDSQIIDSFGLVALVKFLESEFQMTVPNEALVEGKLTSLRALVDLVKESTS